MMQFIRDHANSVWAKLLLGGVAISLAGIGGTQIFSGPSADTVATVNGEKVTLQEVEAQYQQILNANAQNRELTDDQQRQYRLIARQDLLQRRAMDSQIKEWKIRASNRAVAQEIVSIPAFQKEGVFDQEIYRISLYNAGYNVESFEAAVRRDVQESVVREAIVNSVFVPERAVVEQIEFAGQTRDIEVASINFLEKADPSSVTDDEIKSEYEASSGKYITPNRVKLQYLELTMDAIPTPDLAFSDEDIAKEADKLKKEGEQRLSEQFTIEYNSDAEEQAAIAIFNDLKARLDSGAITFDEAKDEIAHIDNAYYNLNGNFRYGAAGIPAFDDVLFSLTEDAPISKPFAIESEVHMVHLINIDTPYANDEALTAAAKKSLTENAKANAYLAAEARMQELAETYTDSLGEIAEDLGVELKETDWLDLDKREGLLSSPTVWSAVGTYDVSENNRNSLPFAYNDQANHAMIVRIADEEVSRPQTLEESFSAIRSELAQNRAKEKIRNQIDAMLESGDVQNLQNEAAQLGFAYNQYNDLSITSVGQLSKPVEQYAISNGFQKVSKLENDQPKYIVEEVDGHLVIVGINNITKGKMDDISKEDQAQIHTYLQGIEANYEYRAFQQYLLNSSKVKIYNNAFFE